MTDRPRRALPLRTLLLAAAWSLVSLGCAGAADAPFDIDTIGPQPGDTVPAFTLPDAAGRPHTLESLMGPKGLVLVFFRSADW